MGEARSEQWEPNVRGPRPVSGQGIDFVKTLVDEVASKDGVKRITQLVPDGALSQILRGTANPVDGLVGEALEIEGLSSSQVELHQFTRNSSDPTLVVSSVEFAALSRPKTGSDELKEHLVAGVKQLSVNDVAILVTPSFFHTFTKGKLDQALEDQGIHIRTVIFPPKEFLEYATVRPTFVIVSRKPSEKTLVLDCQNYQDLPLRIADVLLEVESADLRGGVAVELETFEGPQHFEVMRAFESLVENFPDYQRIPLAEIATSINFVTAKGEFAEEPNSIFLPLIGTSPAVISEEDRRLKPQNYAQIIVDPAKADLWFVKSFMNSKPFRQLLEARSSGRQISRLNRGDVRALEVWMPGMPKQVEIGNAVRKLNSLQHIVESLAAEVSINPQSGSSVADKIESALEVFGQLSREDRIYSIIRDGESKTVEFKQTFALDIADNTKKDFLEIAVIKTIAAFMNSDGGDLLVGVSDSGSTTGLDFEIEKLHRNSNDKFLLNFKNRIKHRIGEQVYPILNYELVSINERVVLHVSCKPSDTEVFVDGDDFYVRTNPATDKLTGKKLSEYLKQRFR